MDQNQNPYYNTMPPYQKPNYMETAALTLGVVSIVTCSCCYLSLPLGGIAIVLGLLSRGGKMKLGSKAKIGIALATMGLLLTIILYAASFYIAINEFGSFENLLRESCEMYGLDFDALYGDMFQ